MEMELLDSLFKNDGTIGFRHNELSIMVDEETKAITTEELLMMDKRVYGRMREMSNDKKRDSQRLTNHQGMELRMIELLKVDV
ncbi:unnamed protein product [Brassica oleracea var. botrytis]|uniref:(rape) hypothetical protein n=1 Tax=Brassica napus TaxID=3708 RepID=A0A816QML3_BRANA|nr:unnamed protein product [Brassica napus]